MSRDHEIVTHRNPCHRDGAGNTITSMPKKIHRLKSGFFEMKPEEMVQAETPSTLDRKALLVYTGNFESMDGLVEVKDEHITRLHDNHNSLLSRIGRMASGEIPLKFCPPIQLDHSLSAKDTVGRLVGLLEIGDHEPEPGKSVKALFGMVRILGKENVEKVVDGRWTNLSIGADLEDGKFSELTITPFPAAADAAMLASTRPFKGDRAEVLPERDGYRVKVKHPYGYGRSFPSLDQANAYAEECDKGMYRFAAKTQKYKGEDIKITQGEGESWYLEVGEIKRGPFQKEQDAYLEGCQIVESGVLKKLSNTSLAKPKVTSKFDSKTGTYTVLFDGVEFETGFKSMKEALDWGREFIENHKMSKGEQPMLARLKAFLMRTMKLSAEDADKKMSEMPEADKAKMQGDADKDHERMKKHLMDRDKCSAEDADKRMAEMNVEDMKKLAEECDEKEKMAAAQPYEGKETAEEEKLEPTHKMAKAKEELTKLSADFRKISEGTRLAAKKAQLSVRLSKLRADAKITPAEVKKIDLAKLSAASDETVEEVFKSYENREPVILTGLIGSKNETNVSDVYKAARMSALEKDVRANMSLLSKAKSTNLAAEMEPKKEASMMGEVSEMDQEIAMVHKLIDEGKLPEAKERIKAWGAKYMSPAAQHQAAAPVHAEMSALAESVKLMQNEFDKAMQLIGSIVG